MFKFCLAAMNFALILLVAPALSIQEVQPLPIWSLDRDAAQVILIALAVNTIVMLVMLMKGVINMFSGWRLWA